MDKKNDNKTDFQELNKIYIRVQQQKNDLDLNLSKHYDDLVLIDRDIEEASVFNTQN